MLATQAAEHHPQSLAAHAATTTPIHMRTLCVRPPSRPRDPTSGTASAEIWDALKAACSSDTEMAKVLLEAAEVKVMKADMSVCYDARGFRYELPPYVLADPTNIVAQ